jgi:hypothetical protein
MLIMKNAIKPFAVCITVFTCLFMAPVFAQQKTELSDPEIASVAVTESDNAELKGLLQNVLPTLKIHLSHAEMVQKNITK